MSISLMPQIEQSVQIDVPHKFRPLYEKHRYKTYYGGRGGRKSWEFARAALILGATEKKLILCTREFQGSIQDSVHRLLSNQIVMLGLESFYRIEKARIYGLNGTEFIFEGLKNNVTKIKSCDDNPTKLLVDAEYCETLDHTGSPVSEYGKLKLVNDRFNQ